MIHNSNSFVKKSEIPKTCHNNTSIAGKSRLISVLRHIWDYLYDYMLMNYRPVLHISHEEVLKPLCNSRIGFRPHAPDDGRHSDRGRNAQTLPISDPSPPLSLPHPPPPSTQGVVGRDCLKWSPCICNWDRTAWQHGGEHHISMPPVASVYAQLHTRPHTHTHTHTHRH